MSDETTAPEFLTAFLVALAPDGRIIVGTETGLNIQRQPTPGDVEGAALRLAADMNRILLAEVLKPQEPETPAKRVKKKLDEQRKR